MTQRTRTVDVDGASDDVVAAVGVVDLMLPVGHGDQLHWALCATHKHVAISSASIDLYFIHFNQVRPSTLAARGSENFSFLGYSPLLGL